jgi:hypothetical protein
MGVPTGEQQAYVRHGESVGSVVRWHCQCCQNCSALGVARERIQERVRGSDHSSDSTPQQFRVQVEFSFDAPGSESLEAAEEERSPRLCWLRREGSIGYIGVFLPGGSP